MSVFKILYLLLQLRKLFCHCGICVRQSKRQSQNYFNLLMNIITRHSLLAFRGFVLRGFANSRSCPQNKPKSRTPFSEQDNPQLPNDIYIYIYICVCVCVCARARFVCGMLRNNMQSSTMNIVNNNVDIYRCMRDIAGCLV